MRDKFREFKKRKRVRAALQDVEARASCDNATSRPHELPKPLVVSLTSYPARFGTLALTLKSILRQTVRPDTTILWLSRDDLDAVPAEVHDLRRLGLEIAGCDDFRSYKKIIPVLQNHKDCFVITVDDDVYYSADVIEKLVGGHDPANRHVVARRAHKIITDRGRPEPYRHWKHGIDGGAETSSLIFPTGVGGVLYAPDAFHEDVGRSDIFTEICSTADDVWLYWMWRMNGYLGHKLAGKSRVLEWPGTQETSLLAENVVGGGNDRCIQNMIQRYGFPV